MQGPRIISFFIISVLLISPVRASDLGARSFRAEAPDIKSTPSLVVNIPAMEVSLYDSGRLVYRLPIAVGSPIYKTPVGPRFLSTIVWNPWWFPPPSPWAKGAEPTPPGPQNPLGVVKMDMGEAIFLHGTNKEWSIGHPASHGCMRMKNADARNLAWWLQTHLTDKTDPVLLEEYGKKRWQSYTIKLDLPVPVEIQYEVFKMNGDVIEAHPDFYGRVGEREEMVTALLESKGVKMEHVYQAAFEKLLNDSQKRSVEMSLRELFPGTMTEYSPSIPDPVDEVWRVKQNLPKPALYSNLPLNFTFLF
ncbi:MAG: L,D-transpeptidase family protein [Deltaproteobacteria bacterium]|nr:L,D-transpeptidase family protein [Deltaproteobacteria bacterium]